MEEQKVFRKAEKRWIVRELQSGRMTMGEAKTHFADRSKNPESLIKNWLRDYQPEIDFTLPVMTEKEKQKLDAAHLRVVFLTLSFAYALHPISVFLSRSLPVK